jgi:hypothetical protein
MKKSRVVGLLAVAIMIFGTVQDTFGGSINTVSTWNGSENVGNFGYPDTATFGQTITATSGLGSQLDSFSFEVNLPAALTFRGEVYAWNSVTSSATGSALFESAPTQTPGPGFQQVTFNTGGVQVNDAQQYVIFATILNDYAADAGKGTGIWGLRSSDPYAGGSFVFLSSNGNGDPSQLTTQAWDTGFSPQDLAFIANFSDGPTATPEPASMTLLAIGAFGMAGYGWRRRQQQQKVADEVVG